LPIVLSISKEDPSMKLILTLLGVVGVVLLGLGGWMGRR
jgi:hypothetical protein